MKTDCSNTVVLGFLILIAFLATGAIAQDTRNVVLRVNGAGMASDQVDRWAKQFMEANPDTRITVIGSSAGKGLQAFIDGNAEIAMMSRETRVDERKKAIEKGIRLGEKPIGRAAIALITHPRNPLNELTLEQVRKIYTGEYDNWKQVGGPDAPVRCLTRRIPESGGAVFFWNKVLDGEPFGSKTVMTETWEAIIKVCSVAEDLPIGIAPSTRNLSHVKVLSIRNDDKSIVLAPKEQTIKDGSYPIVLTFSFVWDEGSKNPAAMKFADFCQSQGGGSGGR
jgi:phosphate transport system substrate-binding protein